MMEGPRLAGAWRAACESASNTTREARLIPNDIEANIVLPPGHATGAEGAEEAEDEDVPRWDAADGGSEASIKAPPPSPASSSSTASSILASWLRRSSWAFGA